MEPIRPRTPPVSGSRTSRVPSPATLATPTMRPTSSTSDAKVRITVDHARVRSSRSQAERRVQLQGDTGQSRSTMPSWSSRCRPDRVTPTGQPGSVATTDPERSTSCVTPSLVGPIAAISPASKTAAGYPSTDTVQIVRPVSRSRAVTSPRDVGAYTVRSPTTNAGDHRCAAHRGGDRPTSDGREPAVLSRHSSAMAPASTARHRHGGYDRSASPAAMSPRSMIAGAAMANIVPPGIDPHHPTRAGRERGAEGRGSPCQSGT